MTSAGTITQGTATMAPLGLSLTEAADAIVKGETTSVALTKASIEAFRQQDGSINSLIRLDVEEALETAEGLDRLRNAGRLLGPLHGVPLAHKDMYYQTGKHNTAGSKIRREFKPAYASTALQRLEAAGSITVGALNMAEFAQNRPGTTPTSATAGTHGTRTSALADRRQARARLSPHDLSMVPSAPTRGARSASRHHCVVSRGSKARRRACRGMALCRSRSRQTMSARWHARRATVRA